MQSRQSLAFLLNVDPNHLSRGAGFANLAPHEFKNKCPKHFYNQNKMVILAI